MSTNGTSTLKNAELIAKLTLEEKAALCDGKNFWYLKGIEKLGLPEIMVSDGPHGLRKQDPNGEKKGLSNSVPAVCFPTACTTGCSWDPDLLYEMGVALGEKCLKENVSVILGPGVNMKRSPLCGRNFEYFSEDPYLSGELSAALINGVQSMGIGTSLKHFAINNQETRRMSVSVVVDERTIREIYFPAFEKAVKDAKPWTVMNAYNKINGIHCSENDWLQNKVLRDEWGFDGLVVSDWGAVNNRIEGIKGGNDLEMPTSRGLHSAMIAEAVNNGTLDEADLDKCVDNVLSLIIKANDAKKPDFTFDETKHHELAKKVAAQSFVLLKNNNNILPIKSSQKIAVVGELAKKPCFQGNGSSLINPTKVDCVTDCLDEAGVEYSYYQGYVDNVHKADKKLISEAVAGVKDADIVLLFVGLSDPNIYEGFDRLDMNLHEHHTELAHAITNANPNTVVIYTGGSASSMPWAAKARGILGIFMAGQAGAGAVVDTLLGKTNPSGKLAETYPIDNDHTPSKNFFPGNPVTVEYRESIYIGYRYFDKTGTPVLFPFGHGLSYTSFEYSDIKVSKDSFKDDEEIIVSFKIKNTGNCAGAEVAQLYVSDDESTIFRPDKELKGFRKVWLEPSEEKEISIPLSKRAFAYYNVNIHDWHVESGSFTINICSSSVDRRLSCKVNIQSTAPEVIIPDYRKKAPDYYLGANLKNVPFDQFEAILGFKLPPTEYDKSMPIIITNCLADAAHTKNGRRINRLVTWIIRKFVKDDSGMVNSIAFLLPFRNMVSMSGGLFNRKMCDGLLRILNSEKGGIRMLLSGIPTLLKNYKTIIKEI